MCDGEQLGQVEQELREARAATDQITEAFLRTEADRDKAKHHLRQVIIALDDASDRGVNAHRSHEVYDALQAARAYLQEEV